MDKEPDLYWRSRLLKSFVLMFGPFHIVGLIYPFHILWATLATVVCAPLAVWIADRALYLVNQVIDKAPDLPEALFLKAQILWEGFGNQAAEGYLKKVLRLVKVGEPLHRWALNYHEQVRRL